MIRIAISSKAFNAVSARLPFGTVSFEREPDAHGRAPHLLAPEVVNRLRCPARARRKLQRQLVELEARGEL